MTKRSGAILLAAITVDHASAVPLYHQLYDGLREAILSGRLVAGSRLPATRTLARDVAVSRNTVMYVYEQLIAEGYLEGKVGDGTYVMHPLPDELLRPQGNATPAKPSQLNTVLARRGLRLAETPASAIQDSGVPRAFLPGVPAPDIFPFNIWARLTARRWRRPPHDLLGYGDPAGYRPLREAIAAYLRSTRAVRCEPEQVIIVSGTQQAVDLVARILLDPDDIVWVEDPGFVGGRGAFLSAGAHLVAVPVDEEGMDLTAALAQHATARLAFVSPSYQYPLGVTMSLARRSALLEWASRVGAWVLEDDYNSEYRYVGQPLASLQGLDSTGRVIYMGTLNTVLLSILRIGYLVVPPHLVDAFTSALVLLDRHAPSLDQVVLTDFMVEGHFSHHIWRMRSLYAERQEALIEAIRRELAGYLEVKPTEAGMHLVGWLPEGMGDRIASQLAANQGIVAPPLSAHTIKHVQRGGLLLGYAVVNTKEIRAGVHKLAAALNNMGKIG